MKAVIITIGDEILIGQIVDTNSAFIAKSLDKIGIEISEMVSISDTKEVILETFAKYQNKADVVIVTGGLGPTKDDVTKKTFCDYFEDQLVIDNGVLAHVTTLIEAFYKMPITQMNKDQALVPSKSTLLVNALGTAPGMWMKKETTVFISLPGVPYEMRHIMEQQVIPKLVQEYSRPYILHKTIVTYGQGESILAERIATWEDHLPSFLKLAYLPSPGKVLLRISARGTNKEALEQAIAEQVASLNTLIGDVVVGYEEDQTIEVVVGQLLQQQHKTLATAESCTGGSIASLLASVPGASAYFKGSVVCYATAVKTKVLGIPEELLQKFSVVSSEVASAMALSVKELLQTDYALATTGNAGPSKGESAAAIGTVFIALATPKGVIVEEFNFGQPREKVVDRAVYKGLEMLMKEISKNVL
ncbi:CinA family nicotinamide mononucleotide deamidase-related protein [Flavobacterium crassostreae]|uniref:CinA family nicotinamide mononucleotide deamidase-related protein n=1 Tax=Flavobacterium crassostreae TaxID=1763534 RepID=UPI0008A1008D|nr:CinA family nicotinamide mononucleotide deamidase-related protein [Flavobacterium crassostreae]